jgi:TolB-like protein
VLDALLAKMLAPDPAQRPRDGPKVGRLLSGLGEMVAATAVGHPWASAALSQHEQRFALAAVVEVDTESEPDATMGAVDASEAMARVAQATREAGGQFAPLSSTTGLVVVEARGTLTDRTQVAVGVLRAVLSRVPGSRAAMTAGLSASMAQAPVGETLARAGSLLAGLGAGQIAVDTTVGELLRERFEVSGALLGEEREEGSKQTPFVGRDKEMALLDATLSEVIEEGTPRGVLLTAPAEAVTDEIVDALSMTRGLRARPAPGLSATAEDPVEVGRRLGVNVVVVGSVRSAGDQVRIQARVLGMADGFQVWAQRFDCRSVDTLKTTDDVARAVAEALTVDLRTPERRPVTNPEVTDLYLRARSAVRHRWYSTQGDEDITLLERGLGLSPEDPGRLSHWGDTVNLASRMESHGVAGAIQLSEAAAQAVGPGFVLEDRGTLAIKGKGDQRAFLLVRREEAPETVTRD